MGLALTKPVYGQSGVRHIGGVTSIQAFVWNMGSCRRDAKRNAQMAETARANVSMRGTVTDGRVRAMNSGNTEGAKASRYSAFPDGQPFVGGAIG